MNIDKRIISKYQDLILLNKHVHSIGFNVKNIKTSKLSGRHGSKLRGRGVDFEEIKNYRKGDDVKSIDWKLTLRTGQPYIRAYTEEKDRNIFICVDQRKSMFFSSVNTMKSVVASEVATLFAFKMLSNNDRVGGIISNDNTKQWFQPKRGEKNVLNFIKAISVYNQNLLRNKDTFIEKERNIEDDLNELLKRKVRDSIIILISDFYGLANDIDKKLKKLQSKNDVICIHVSDSLENEWNDNIELVFSDGEMQFSSEGKNKKIRDFFNKEYENKKNKLLELSKIKGLPFIELNTQGDHIHQLSAQLRGV